MWRGVLYGLRIPELVESGQVVGIGRPVFLPQDAFNSSFILKRKKKQKENINLGLGMSIARLSLYPKTC